MPQQNITKIKVVLKRTVFLYCCEIKINVFGHVCVLFVATVFLKQDSRFGIKRKQTKKAIGIPVLIMIPKSMIGWILHKV